MPTATDNHWSMPPNPEKALMLARCASISAFSGLGGIDQWLSVAVGIAAPVGDATVSCFQDCQFTIPGVKS
jgi:hypothetical protein